MTGMLAATEAMVVFQHDGPQPSLAVSEAP
jgi:hypothetical protein